MPLYRIAYLTSSVAHSVVRPLASPPAVGDEIAVDANTVVTVREVVTHPAGDTIAAEVRAEANGAAGRRASP